MSSTDKRSSAGNALDEFCSGFKNTVFSKTVDAALSDTSLLFPDINTDAPRSPTPATDAEAFRTLTPASKNEKSDRFYSFVNNKVADACNPEMPETKRNASVHALSDLLLKLYAISKTLFDQHTAELSKTSDNVVSILPVVAGEDDHHDDTDSPVHLVRNMKNSITLGTSTLFETVNQYYLVKPVGTGATASVFMGVDSRTKMPVAIKKMFRPKKAKFRLQPPEESERELTTDFSKRMSVRSTMSNSLTAAKAAVTSGEILSPIEKEIRVLHRLHHRHIVTLKEVIDDDEEGCVYLVTDYATQGPILRVLPYDQERSCMPCTTVRPLSLAVDYCYQLLTALVYMRSCRVIHNDIKPDNVLIKEDGGILLIDFGESVVFPQSFVFGGNATIRLDANSASTRTKVDAFNALRSITQSDLYDYNSESSLYVPSGINAAGKVLDRGVVGTPAFVAPELINLECSPKCDVWSFGVLVYCMVFGRLPFAAANTRDTYEAVLSAPLTFPAFEAYQDDLTETEYEQWKSFCTEILVREPAVRPSADALLRHKLLETRTLFPLALPAVKSVVTNPLVPDGTSRSHTSSDGSELLQLVSITSDVLPVSVVPRAPARQMIVSTKEEAAVLQVAEEASRSRMTRLSEAVKTNS